MLDVGFEAVRVLPGSGGVPSPPPSQLHASRGPASALVSPPPQPDAETRRRTTASEEHALRFMNTSEGRGDCSRKRTGAPPRQPIGKVYGHVGMLKLAGWLPRNSLGP